jgi:2-amino-4-hydroxy-6-hydroxymethyldihydropteridine diphosphokinase
MAGAASEQPLGALPRWRAFVALGGNQGDVQAAFVSALNALAALPATSVEATSSLYRTQPVDAEGPDFLNAVVALQCGLGPLELLGALMAIEHAHERVRDFHHAPRTLDLDLLWFGDATRESVSLTLPHPRMTGRAFVLTPLSEVMAEVGAEHAGGSPQDPLPSAVGPNLPHAAERERLAAAQGVERLGPWPPRG